MGGGGGETEIRFAPYIEIKHYDLLNAAAAERKSIIDDSPYSEYAMPSTDDAFFGIGYSLSNFPSLYDTFGKQMAGVNIDELFTSSFSEKMNCALSDGYIDSEVNIIDDHINQMAQEKILSRDANSATSTTFINAQANIESSRIKKVTELRIRVRYSLIPGIVKTWNKTLSWNKETVLKYAEAMLSYYLCKINTDEAGYNKKTENTIWPLTVLDFERSLLAAMRGTRVSRVGTKEERSLVSKVLVVASYTVQGAQIGSYFPPYGTIIGAIVGFVIGLAIILLE